MINFFESGATTIDLTVPPVQGVSESKALDINRSIQSDGSRIGYKFNTDNSRTFGIVIAPLSLAKVNEMRLFFSVTVGGMGKSFTWYDHEGTALQVILMSSIGSSKINHDKYSATLTLKEG